MVSFNRVVLAGNLTREPELRFTGSGVPVVNFGLAVNRVRSRSEEVDFFDVAAWRELGETIAEYKKKGDPILIEGRLKFDQWQSEDGTNRNKVSVVADNVQFLSSGSGQNGSGGGQRSRGKQGAPAAAGSGGQAAEDEDFDDIDPPF